MESVLSLLCIVFFSLLTYGLIQGYNLQKHHKFNCRTIYIPEDIDLETAFDSIKYKNLDQLKKRARQLGATKDFVDSLSELELKVFIVQNSISNEHILFKELEEEIKMREDSELVKKRDYCRTLYREGLSIEGTNCPEQNTNTSLNDYNNVIISDNTSSVQQDLQNPEITIQELQEDFTE